MARIVWTAPALGELSEVAEYIALDNPPAAKKLVKTVFATISRLKDYPESGRLPAELAGLNYREVVAPPCRIFYRMDGDQVFILHVMRQEQEMRRFLLRDK